MTIDDIRKIFSEADEVNCNDELVISWGTGDGRLWVSLDVDSRDILLNEVSIEKARIGFGNRLYVVGSNGEEYEFSFWKSEPMNLRNILIILRTR